MPGKHVEKLAVFLNIPYDDKFSNLYLAYIVAVSSFGFLPKATLLIPGHRRLDRISELIDSSAFSIHDLSRVELDRNYPSTPRFNMSFELGLAVARASINSAHRWFVMEAVNRRALKSLSDLNGTDVYIHNGRIDGVMREICNMFLSSEAQPTVPEMMRTYRQLRLSVPGILRKAGSSSIYSARAFSDISVAAAVLVRKHRDQR